MFFFLNQLVLLLHNHLLMVIIFPCCGSREQMCLLEIYIYVCFYLESPFSYFFYFSSDYLHCNAVTYIQGETSDKCLLWEGRHTSMVLRRLGPVRQQHTFQLDIKMQIIQSSVHVKVRLGRTLIRSEIKLKSLCALVIPSQLCLLGIVCWQVIAVQENPPVIFLSLVQMLAVPM